ncbi:MAG: tetratricopeptide repeat protein [Candidatus Hermodarchaeota archaeon]
MLTDTHIINYPPNEILEPPSKITKPNFELIILWMLNNNASCSSANFLEIKNLESNKKVLTKSTLYNYLKDLIEDGYITKSDYNKYHITPKGRDRFYELSQVRYTKRKLNFPPEVILRKRNYNHWILWMLFNNNFCKWADFLNEPLRINQSSLSKNINQLLSLEYIRKEDKEYRITRLGKIEYSNMLRLYDLDRQSVLEEEGKRIKEITISTINFFKKYDIKDEDIKFRFINNILKLPFEKVESSLDVEEDFYKILLFLAFNHPDQYPFYTSSEDFSRSYNINHVKLNFILLRIVEENIFPIKFFKLEQNRSEIYYFQENEKLERMLNAIVEDHITKFSYLNNLYEATPYEVSPLTMESTVAAILEEICVNLFDKGLKKSLRKFLPEYINYLAYKIEKEKKLVDTYDKLEGLIWQEIQAYNFDSNIRNSDINEAIREIDKAIKKDPKNVDLYYSKSKILYDNGEYKKVLEVLDKMLLEFPKEEKNIQVKRAYVFKEMKDVKTGLNIINDLLVRNPEDNDLLNYKAFWLQYLNRKAESMKTIQSLIDRAPNNATYHDSYGEILMFFKDYENAIEEFLKVIEINSDDWYLYQTNIKLGICFREIENYQKAIEFLQKGKELTDKSSSDPDEKSKWLAIANLFLAEIEQLKDEF